MRVLARESSHSYEACLRTLRLVQSEPATHNGYASAWKTTSVGSNEVVRIKTKYGNIVVIYVEYPDLFKVITLTKGRKSK